MADSEFLTEVPTGWATGSNQLGVKDYNERLVIDVVRRAGAASKADITRITQLSAQTITVIANRLIAEGYLKKGEAVKGKVGQPSVPLSLDPEGATSVGIKLGRRTLDISIMSFDYQDLAHRSLEYDYPEVDAVFDWLNQNLAEMIEALPDVSQSRIRGIGVAVPAHLDAWEGVIRAPMGVLQKWCGIDVASIIQSRFPYPVYQINDATAACLAELSLHHRRQRLSCMYFFIGTFFGGGIVLDGQLYLGHTGQAGAVASLPLSLPTIQTALPPQMVTAAGLHSLESKAREKGLKRRLFLTETELSDDEQALFDSWAQDAAQALAFAIIGGQSFLDVPTVIIDGRLPDALVTRITDYVRDAFARFDLQGIQLPEIRQGRLGARARSSGAAIVPLHQQFAIQTSQLMKVNEQNKNPIKQGV